MPDRQANRNLKLYDIVEYAGYRWFVINLDKDSATLLACDNVFGSAIYSEGPNTYGGSEARKYLLSNVWPILKAKKARPMPAILPDSPCKDRLYLLSFEEARKLPVRVRRFDKGWWVRSSVYSDSYASFVSYGGMVGVAHSSYEPMAMRPAIQVPRNLLES